MENSDTTLPHSTDAYLRALWCITDALKRNAFSESLKITGKTLATVQNEIDWCYRTDTVLPSYVQLLVGLGDAIATAEMVTPSCRAAQVRAIIDVVTTTREELAQHSSGRLRYPAPDSNIDALEREHRARTYGYAAEDRVIYNEEAARHGNTD